MKFLSKLCSSIIDIVFYPFLVVLMVALMLFLCGVRPYITMSGSMEPEIKTASMCFVNTQAAYEDIQEGDVIAFEISTGNLVTHRVISVTDAGLETKGDANEVSDGISTTKANFRGKTLFSIPYIGYVVKYLQQPTGIAIVLIIVAGIAALGVVDHLEKKEEGNKKK